MNNWLKEFEQRQGHPLRVLHLGNIANNAYFTSKHLRRVGVIADVLCYNNYAVTSSPEWEEADLDREPKDFLFPKWNECDLKGYQRPRWFVQGPFDLCVQYLLAERNNQTATADTLWQQLTRARELVQCNSYRRAFTLARRIGLLFPDSIYQRGKAIIMELTSWLVRSGSPHLDSISRHSSSRSGISSARWDWLIQEFRRRFPSRSDQLKRTDALVFESLLAKLPLLFSHYDLVHAYATDPILPMLIGFRPYVAFEHGTLRDFPSAKWDYKGPFYPNSLGRLVALSFALADHVLITNADCLSSAQRLGLTHYSPIGHPIDEQVFMDDTARDRLHQQYNIPRIFFCPVRHDWGDKGIDKYFEALPYLRQTFGNQFRVFFTPWGKEIPRSKRRIAELQCEDLVEWVGPFGQRRLAQWLAGADVIFDQLAFASLSGTAPRALAAGTPVICSYESEQARWMFPEPPPILYAQSVADILAQTVRAIDPRFQANYKTRARDWIMTHHSSDLFVEQVLSVYERVLSK